MAKKHEGILTDMLKLKPVAAGAVADPSPYRNHGKLTFRVSLIVLQMVIQRLQALPEHALSISGWINYLKSTQAAHSLPGWTKSRGKPTNMLTGWT